MTDESTNATTARERLEMHLAQALTRAQSHDVQRHLEAALEECRQLPPTPLVECPLCGRVGLPERVKNHCCTDLPERLDR
jgi:ribosomal protein L32